MFHHGPGDGETVESRSTAANFIEKNEACGRSVVENRGYLAHFHKKGGTPARQIVAGTDTREDPIGDGKLRLPRGNEGADLRHQHDESGLAEIGRFATHVRPGDQKKLLVARFEIKIVGNEPLTALAKKFFNHRMPASDNEKLSGGSKLGAIVAAISGQFSERGEHIELGDCGSRAT